MKKYLYLLLIFLNSNLFAQDLIRGKVIDAKDETPLPGAAVRIIASQPIITTSNLRGGFAIKPKAYPVQLKVSFLGYQSLDTLIEAPVSSLVIRLKAAENKLAEVIISTGYQQLKKE